MLVSWGALAGHAHHSPVAHILCAVLPHFGRPTCAEGVPPRRQRHRNAAWRQRVCCRGRARSHGAAKARLAAAAHIAGGAMPQPAEEV